MKRRPPKSTRNGHTLSLHYALPISIGREGESRPLQISVTRVTIKLASVRGRMLEPGYAYIRISAFQDDTAADFESTLKRLQAGSGDRLRGMVLDLSSNPGGLTTTAVQIAEDLLEEGGIVRPRGRSPRSDAKFTAETGRAHVCTPD